MNLRQTLILAAVLLGCLTVGAFLGRPVAAEPKAEAATVGRYQVVPLVNANQPGSIVVPDTTTGECWENDGLNGGAPEKNWQSLGVPGKAK